MKKTFLFLAFSSLIFNSCRNDDNTSTVVDEVSVELQNTYDDGAIQKFLTDNYFDSRGNIVAFSSTSTADDNETPLSGLNPVRLSSGVVYLSRYLPTNAKTIVSNDKIKWMIKADTYLGTKDKDGVIKFSDLIPFRNSIASSGVLETDPPYFYVKTSVLTKYNTDNKTSKTRSFYEIEGLQEGLRYFKSCEIPDSENYNLQGVIIVPSRAAYARDEYFPFIGNGSTLRNRSFVFNFQVYGTETRLAGED